MLALHCGNNTIVLVTLKQPGELYMLQPRKSTKDDIIGTTNTTNHNYVHIHEIYCIYGTSPMPIIHQL